jgi:hypothetical protein
MSHAAALEFYVFGDNRLTQVDRFDSVPWPSQLLPEPVRASWSLNAGFEQIKVLLDISIFSPFFFLSIDSIPFFFFSRIICLCAYHCWIFVGRPSCCVI